jgi:polar amino acid transport system substrate-binding protein
LTRPPLSPRLTVTATALLALVLIPGSAQATAMGPARLAPCNPADPLHPTGSLRPAGPPAVTPGSLMAAIRARGYLVAGVDLTLYHLSYQNPLDGRIEGFNIDMLHAISQAIFGSPDRIRFVSLQDAARLPAVRAGAVDIVAQPTTVTCARLRLVDFSTVYLTTHQRPIIVAKPQGLALSARHPEFVRFVNAVLAGWRASGGWAASYARWIGTPVPVPPALRYAD